MRICSVGTHGPADSLYDLNVQRCGGVGDGVTLGDGVEVSMVEGVEVGDGLGVGVAVGVGVSVGLGVGVGVGVMFDGVRVEGDSVGEGVALGFCCAACARVTAKRQQRSSVAATLR